ncbi:MAG: hypothetical protein V2A70_01265 [Candidatus Omnitrophota bacterium]
MRKYTFSVRILSGFMLLVLMVMSLTGCMTLRKKFTRVKKNKNQKEDFIPVLRPIEYQKVEETPLQVYTQQYAMVKVYFKDLWDVLGKRDVSAKRAKYMLTEILSHFDAMTALLIEAKREQALQLRGRLNLLLAIYDAPDALRRYDLLTGSLRVIERDLYQGFKPAVVESALVSGVK